MSELRKKMASFRLDPVQIEQLERLVKYYQTQTGDLVNHNFSVKVSKASVLELLIREKYNEVLLNKIKE